MNNKVLLTLGFTFFTLGALANTEQKLFTMEKNYNQENLMIIHTQTDKDCKFIKSTKNSEGNYIEFYWLMNGKDRKEVHPMIRTEIKSRVQFQGIDAGRDSFRVKLNDLSEVKHDLVETSMEVASEIINGKCTVKSVLTLGPSGKYRKIDLNRTFCNVSKNLVGVPNGCNYLLLEGTDVATGEKLSVKFTKR